MEGSVSRTVRDSQSDSSVDDLSAPLYDNTFRGGQKGLQFGNRSSGLFSNPSTSKSAGDSQTNRSVDQLNTPEQEINHIGIITPYAAEASFYIETLNEV